MSQATYSREQMLSASSLPFSLEPYDSDEALIRAFNENIEGSLRAIANGIAVYWMKRNSDQLAYKHSLGICHYRYRAGAETKRMKPYLEHILGPKQYFESVVLPARLNEAFPGFKNIKITVVGDWDYIVDIELGE